MIEAAPGIFLDDSEIEERFIRSSGPGGQNVNKLATAVQLRFDVRRSASLSEGVRARLEKLAGRRLTKEGILVITAQRFRTQDRNRADALARLVELVARAATPPKLRRPTRMPAAARKKRLEVKSRRAAVKSLRSRPRKED